jgi:hypothetical protein
VEIREHLRQKLKNLELFLVRLDDPLSVTTGADSINVFGRKSFGGRFKSMNPAIYS